MVVVAFDALVNVVVVVIGNMTERDGKVYETNRRVKKKKSKDRRRIKVE